MSNFLNFKELSEQEYRTMLGRSMSELAQIITLDSVLKLVEHFGGQEIYISGKQNNNSKLEGILDEDDMLNLCRHYHGSTIKIPRLMSLRLKLRNNQIIKGRNSGARLSELARKFNLTERQIHNILK